MEMMKNLFGGVYQGKTVLVTGHTGFKGSWLCLWLEKLGCNLVGYSLNAPTQPNHFELMDIQMDSITADIRDRDKLNHTISYYKPDIVFHLAAQPLVLPSYENPIETYEVNVVGLLNLYESCRKAESVSAIVTVTSDKCYENRNWPWGYRENDALGGYDPYSSSKACAEILTAAYRRSYFSPNDYASRHNCLIASVRAGNVIGGGDWAPGRLLPDIVKSYFDRKSVLIRSPDSIRPWQHVLDPLHGYLILGQKLLDGKIDCATAWNFGPRNESVKKVFGLLTEIKKNWNDLGYEIQGKDRYHEGKNFKTGFV